MFKIILILVFFAGCSYLGYLYGESFKNRLEQLKECNKVIVLLQNQVVFSNTPLPEAITLLSKKVSKPFDNILKKAADNLRKGKTLDVHSAFYEEFNKHSSELYLNNDDKRILSDFTRSLGESGVYGQEKIFNLTIESLKFNIDEASELAKKNTKLYRYLGICLGAMISIWLI